MDTWKTKTHIEHYYPGIISGCNLAYYKKLNAYFDNKLSLVRDVNHETEFDTKRLFVKEILKNMGKI